MMVQEQTTSERATTDPAGSRWRLAGVVLALLAAWLVMRVAFFEGFWGVDDLHHVRFALAMDHPPENHWETRLPVNALLWGSFQLFGFSDVSVALPSLLGSLLFLLSGVMMSWRLWRSPRMTAWVGLLLAVLPGDVLFSTTPGARIFATGLFCLAATLLMTRTGWASLVVSGVLFGLAIWSHLFVLFYVGIVLLCVAGFRLRPWRQAAAGLVLSVVMFAGPSMAIDAIWTGDPLHSFHVAEKSHLAGVAIDVHARHIRDDQGGIDPMFFVRPVKDLLFSKDANLLGLLAVIGGIVILCRGRLARASRGHPAPAECSSAAETFLSRPDAGETPAGRAGRMPASRESAQATLKVLLVAALLGWLWMSYGTQTPTRYQPFPGTNSYWQPLTFFLAVIAAAGLSKLRPKWSTAAVGVLVLMSLATASLSGPWGQGVKNSELLLQCVKTWPHVSFVADDRTIEDMYVLNGLSIPENIFSTPVARPEIQKLVPPPAANARGTFVMMVNPMRDRVFDTTTTDWIAARRGPEMHTGPTVYRPIGYLLPESLRSRYNFLVRREPYRLHEYAPGKAQMTTPPTQP